MRKTSDGRKQHQESRLLTFYLQLACGSISEAHSRVLYANARFVIFLFIQLTASAQLQSLHLAGKSTSFEKLFYTIACVSVSSSLV
jgi:hypothetical protein